MLVGLCTFFWWCKESLSRIWENKDNLKRVRVTRKAWMSESLMAYIGVKPVPSLNFPENESYHFTQGN